MEKLPEISWPLSPSSSAPLPPREPVAQRKPNLLRKELSVFIGEFIGTFMFLFVSFVGTQIALESSTINPFTPTDQNAPPELLKLTYIALSFGVALAVNVALFADVSGGMFNPAVTLALLLTAEIRWPRALYSIAAQLIASILSSLLVSGLLPGPLPVTTSLDPSMSLIRGLLLETVLTAQLVLAVLMLPPGGAKPLYVGMALFAAEMAGVYLTGGSLNPARTLGPAVVAGFQSSHWIYWVGPAVGSALGAGVVWGIEGVSGEKLG